MIKEIAFDDDRVVGVEVGGDIIQEEIDQLWALVEDKLTRHTRLRMYAEVKGIGNIEFRTWSQNLNKKLKHLRDFEKTAVVSDKSWLETATKIIDAIFPGIEMQHFPLNEVEEARSWVVQ